MYTVIISTILYVRVCHSKIADALKSYKRSTIYYIIPLFERTIKLGPETCHRERVRCTERKIDLGRWSQLYPLLPFAEEKLFENPCSIFWACHRMTDSPWIGENFVIVSTLNHLTRKIIKRAFAEQLNDWSLPCKSCHRRNGSLRSSLPEHGRDSTSCPILGGKHQTRFAHRWSMWGRNPGTSLSRYRRISGEAYVPMYHQLLDMTKQLFCFMSCLIIRFELIAFLDTLDYDEL